MSSTGLTYGKVGVYKIDTPHQLYKKFVFVCVWSCEVESGEKGKKEHLYCSLSVRVWIVFWRNTKTDWTFLYRQLVTEGKENREEKMRWLLVHATSTVLWNFCLPVHLNSITPLYIYITGNHITHFFLLSDLKEIHVHRCCMLHTHLPQQCTWWWCHTLWYTYIYMYKIKSGPYVLLTYDWFTYSFIPSVLCGSTYVPESGWPCGFTHVPTRI